jgi:competence protein ComEC
MLDRTGGLTIDLASRSVTTVAEGQGNHGWWKPAAPTMIERKGWY